MSDRVFQALGVKDELEALRMIESINKFLADVKAITGRDTFTASTTSIKVAASFLKEVGAAATAEGGIEEGHAPPTADQLLGKVLAWKTSFENLPALEAERDELKEKVRNDRVEALIALGREDVRPGCNEHAGKLTPALATYFRNRKVEVEEVEAYLKSASRVLPGERSQPETASGSPITVNAEGRVTDAQGRTYEEILPAEKQDLKHRDPDLWKAMRDDWEKHGRPPGVVEKSSDRP